MRTSTILSILVLFALPAVASAQSLTEIARKERERRVKNTENVTVLGETALREYERASSTPRDDEAETEVKTPTSPDREPSLDEALEAEAELRAHRAACSERLAQVHRELAIEEKRLREGVIRWGETPTILGGYPVVDADGCEAIVGGVPGYTRYEQGRVSCLMATRNRSRYPDEAETCDAIGARVSALRGEIAQGCDAP